MTPDSRTLRGEAERALKLVLGALTGTTSAATTLPELARELTRVKSAAGSVATASKLGLDEESLARLFDATHDAARKAFAEPAPADAANVELALLRLIAHLEKVGERVDGVAPRLAFQSSLDDEAIARRVRAVELVARSLINESYRTQDALLNRLRTLYRPELVDRWLKVAQRGDALSGMSFSDLATLLVNKQEFGRYEPIFAIGDCLRLFPDRRKTLREYLDGIRTVRNGLAHHKPLTALQRRLVERYYEEITGPVLGAYRAGSTTVDPAAFLDTSKEDLGHYLQGLREDLQSVALDVEELKVEVARTGKKVSALEGSLTLIVASGIWFLLSIVVSIFEMSMLDPMKSQEAADRSMRGMAIAGVTFLLAGARIVFNLLAQRGMGTSLAERLKGKQWRYLVAGWTVVGSLVYVPTGTFVMRRFTDSMAGPGAGDVSELALAVSTLNAPRLETILDRGVDPSTAIYNTSIFSVAMSGGSLGPDLQRLPSDQQKTRRLEVIKLLLARGARPAPEDVAFAKSSGQREVAELLEAAVNKPH